MGRKLINVFKRLKITFPAASAAIHLSAAADTATAVSTAAFYIATAAIITATSVVAKSVAASTAVTVAVFFYCCY